LTSADSAWALRCPQAARKLPKQDIFSGVAHHPGKREETWRHSTEMTTASKVTRPQKAYGGRGHGRCCPVVRLAEAIPAVPPHGICGLDYRSREFLVEAPHFGSGVWPALRWISGEARRVVPDSRDLCGEIWGPRCESRCADAPLWPVVNTRG
jgi:hypothetical protein